jgi:hypothetical protein
MTLEKLKYPPRSDKIVLTGSRTIQTAVCSSPIRRGLLAGSVAAPLPVYSCSPPQTTPDHDNRRKHHDPNQCYTTQQPASR